MHDATDARAQHIERLADVYEASERAALAAGRHMMDYRPTYDRAFAAGLRAALRILAPEPDALEDTRPSLDESPWCDRWTS